MKVLNDINTQENINEEYVPIFSTSPYVNPKGEKHVQIILTNGHVEEQDTKTTILI